MKKVFPKNSKRLFEFKPGDIWVNSADIILSDSTFIPNLSFETYANSLVMLSYLLTMTVFSERLITIFLYADESLKVSSQLKKDASIININGIENGSQFLRNLVSDAYKTFDTKVECNPKDFIKAVFGDDIIEAIRNTFSYYSCPGFDSLEDGVESFISDCFWSISTGSFYTPNPIFSYNLSKVFAMRNIKNNPFLVKDAVSVLLQTVEEIRKEVATDYNLLRQAGIYDLNIPALFSVILRESKGPDDLFKIAMKLKSEAKEFRKWCRELNSAKDPLIFLQGIEDAQQALRRLGKVIDSKRETRLQISLFPGYATIQVPFQASSNMECQMRKMEIDTSERKPIAFLTHLLTTARQIQSLERELIRVFGYSEKLAHDVSEYLCRYTTNQPFDPNK